MTSTTLTPETLIPLAVLHSNNGRLGSRTRMQKLSYLTQQNLQDEQVLREGFAFQNAIHGPFSSELIDAITSLEAAGLIERTETVNRAGRTKYFYELTPTGTQSLTANLQHSDDQERIEAICEASRSVVAQYNTLSASNLIDEATQRHSTTPQGESSP